MRDLLVGLYLAIEIRFVKLKSLKIYEALTMLAKEVPPKRELTTELIKFETLMRFAADG
jgi:hypothetical protein